MPPTKIILLVLAMSALVGLEVWRRIRRRREFFAAHSIEAGQLHEILFRSEPKPTLHVIDVRQPLDLLAYSQIIPGSRRIAPKEITENPRLLPQDDPIVVYCTCPSDATSIKIMQRAVGLGFQKIRFLRGGLDAWKQQGYPVEPYKSAFHLDTQV